MKRFSKSINCPQTRSITSVSLYFSPDYLSKDKFQNEKRVARVYYPLSPPLVSPETKFFCRKKKRIQIGRAMRIAPAEK